MKVRLRTSTVIRPHRVGASFTGRPFSVREGLYTVGSGVSDHMAKQGHYRIWEIHPVSQEFNCLNCLDRTLFKVVGKGSVVVWKDITLNFVFYVPKLDCKILSISKLTQDLNCVTKFLPYMYAGGVGGPKRHHTTSDSDWQQLTRKDRRPEGEHGHTRGCKTGKRIRFCRKNFTDGQ